jgi:plastocyanin
VRLSPPRKATRRLAGLGLAVAAALALLGVTAAGAQAPAASASTAKSARVTVNDFYFGPEDVTIKKGGSVKWVWSSANTYPHDVHLKKGPKGLKERATYSTKTTAVTDAEFKKTFTTPGTYHFICTIHPTEMHLTVVVKNIAKK